MLWLAQRIGATRRETGTIRSRLELETRRQLASLTENQLEHVVVDKVLTGTVAAQLESLGEVHGALLLVDLQYCVNMIRVLFDIIREDAKMGAHHTKSWPVTRIMMPPLSLEG